LIYLDTHVVVWLYAGLVGKLSQPVKDLINDNELCISPVVRLILMPGGENCPQRSGPPDEMHRAARSR